MEVNCLRQSWSKFKTVCRSCLSNKQNILLQTDFTIQGGVSLTFRELPKTPSRNVCIAEMCAHSIALGTRTKFQLEILTKNVISGIVYFHRIILDSPGNVSETTPRDHAHRYVVFWCVLVV